MRLPLRDWSWKKRLLVLFGLGVAGVLALGIAGYVLTPIPPVSAAAQSQASIVRYAGGEELGRIGASNRKLVPLSQVSEPAQKAVLAAEDRGFYSEPGISPKGIVRALIANLRGGDISQGGSTITQQYAKNAYLTQQRTWSRKIKEFFISLKLTQKLSKNQILENYLNTIYFGRGASGIEVAARTYFGKDASQLSPAEGAVLAASIRSPAGYDPTRHPQAARARWAYVLDGMVKQGWLSPSQRAGLTYPRVLPPGQPAGASSDPTAGPATRVMDQVLAELGRHGFTEADLAYGGYRITTTLRKPAQEAAVRAVQSMVPPRKPGDAGAPVGALVSVDPKTGDVVAYYGGRTPGGFDYAAGPRGVPAGSTFKPFTLATALDQGLSLTTQVNGASPQTIGNQLVHNDPGDPPFGAIDLVTATQYSVNTAYYNLAQKVGPDNIAAMAHRAGIPDSVHLYNAADNNKPTLGITLGIYDVHVVDQAGAFGTFANGGVHEQTHFVSQVASGATVVYQARPASNRAFSAGVAADATYAMQQVVLAGTGTRAQLAGGRPTAGKTGTTQDNKDAWFCGFTPQLATAVWIGRANGSPLKGVLGSTTGVYGAGVPAGIWKAYMDAALNGQPALPFPPRANVGQQQAIGVTPVASPLPPSPVTRTATPTPSPSPSVVPTASPSPTGTPSPATPSPLPPVTAPPITASPSPAGRSPAPSPTG